MEGSSICLTVVLLVITGAANGYVLNDIEIDSGLVHDVVKREAKCGGKVSSNAGEIQLPTTNVNGTEFYGVDQDCKWTIRGLEGHQLLLTSEYFNVELSDNCQWDYVEIYEKTLNRRSRYCGWTPLNYIAADNDIEVIFKSDQSYEDRGFKIMVSTVSADDSGCNQALIGAANTEGEISNRDDGSNCYYSIQAPDGFTVELTLKVVRMGAEPCESERITVHDGMSSLGNLIWTICSDAVVHQHVTHAKSVFIEHQNPAGNEGDRFVMSYSIVEDNFTPPPPPVTTPSPVGGDNDCSQMIKDVDNMDTMEKTIKGPEYQNNKECVVVARATMPGHTVQISFTKFETEMSENCEFDSLRLYSTERIVEDSDDSGAGQIGGPYCGETLKGRTFISTGNSLRFVFKTDESFALYGFKAVVKFIPVGCVCESGNVCVLQDNEKRCIRGRSCNECQNGGTCVATGSDKKCYCLPGYEGEYCTDSDGSVGGLVFVVAPANQNVVRRDDVTVTCKVETESDQLDTYTWYFNQQPLPEYNRFNKKGSLLGGLLKIDSFTETEEGVYSCVARVGDVTAEHTFELSLVEHCEHRIQRGPQRTTLNVGETLLMNCYVTHDVQDVRWVRNGADLDINSDPRMSILNNYLEIKDLTLGDIGTYRCVATDSNGCESYKEADLTVLNIKPHNEYCGKSIHDERARGRLTKADDAKPNDNPWHVTLRRDVPGKKKVAFCGGTLISKNFVVTAAHCIDGFKNFSGGVDISPDNVALLFGTVSCLSSPVERRYKNVIIHENYDTTANTYDNDIALLELETPVEYSISIRPICLEPEVFITQEFFYSTSASGKVVGCGQYAQHRKDKLAEILQELMMPYVHREECERSLEGSKYSLTNNMICGGYKIYSKGDFCHGDSGGGYVMWSGQERWVLSGLVSWGIGRCDSDRYYSMFTNVGTFYDWIENRAKTTEEVVDIDDFSRSLMNK